MSARDHTPGGAWTQLFVDRIDAGNAQAQLILQAISRFADWKTGKCYPKVKTLAEIAKCSDKTVRRYLTKMAGDDIIKLETRHDEKNGSQTSSWITLLGYEEWYIANSHGGTISKPRKVKKYESPPSQDDQGIEPTPLVKKTRGHGRQMTSPPSQQVSSREPSNTNSMNSARSRAKISNSDLKEEGRDPEYVITRQGIDWTLWQAHLERTDRKLADRMRGEFMAWVTSKEPKPGAKIVFPQAGRSTSPKREKVAA